MPDMQLVRVANVNIVEKVVENVSVWDGVKTVAPLPGCERITLDSSENMVFRGWTYDPARLPRFVAPVVEENLGE